MFQSFWYGGSLSPVERLCLSSFTARGISFDLYTYDPDLIVPDGVTLKDAREIYREDKVFTYQEGPGAGSVAAFANMFRYKLLYERGGWWVDMDVLYTGHSLPEEDSFLGRQNETDVCNALMRLKKGSHIAHDCLREAERLGADVLWGEAGPKLLTKIVRRHAVQTARPSYAYPLSWQDAPDIYNPEKTRGVAALIDASEAPFLHLWNEILRRTGIQKTIAPPIGSYLHEVARQLGFEWPNASVRYSAKSIARMYENYKTAQEAQWRLRRIEQSRSWKLLKFLRFDIIR